MVLAGSRPFLSLQEILSRHARMRVYSSVDRFGVELAGALKNAYAVAAGICDGLQLGDNAKAALLTRALTEMVRLGVALGGQPDTFLGLAGIGDLMATSYGPWSRNRQLGERVAAGQSPVDIINTGLTAEGYRATQGLLTLAQQKHIDALSRLCPNAQIRLVDGELFSWYGSRLIKSAPYFKRLLAML
jgi:glycerol-3-phosphate dehydrogenase (NAD(P)+)